MKRQVRQQNNLKKEGCGQCITHARIHPEFHHIPHSLFLKNLIMSSRSFTPHGSLARCSCQHCTSRGPALSYIAVTRLLSRTFQEHQNIKSRSHTSGFWRASKHCPTPDAVWKEGLEACATSHSTMAGMVYKLTALSASTLKVDKDLARSNLEWDILNHVQLS